MIRVRLRLREVAQSKGMNMSQLQRKSGLTMSLIRRYWYNAQDGKRNGKPLAVVSLEQLAILALFLDVRPGELLSDELEQSE